MTFRSLIRLMLCESLGGWRSNQPGLVCSYLLENLVLLGGRIAGYNDCAGLNVRLVTVPLVVKEEYLLMKQSRYANKSRRKYRVLMFP